MPSLIIISVNGEPAFATHDKGVAIRVVEEMERGAVNPNHPITVKELEVSKATEDSWL